MKKTLLYTVVSIGLLATSCQEEHNIEFTEVGSEFFISDSGITSLDEQTTISITNQQKNLSKVELYDGDTKLGDIAIEDGKGTIDLKASDLGLVKIGHEVKVVGKTSYNGKAMERHHTITVSDATSYSVTGDLVEFKADNDTLFVEVSTAYNDITSVELKGAINDEELKVVPFDEEQLDGTSFEGYVILPNDLAYKDTLKGAIYVTSSVRTEVKEIILPVGGKAFDYSDGASVSDEPGKGDAYLYYYTDEGDSDIGIGKISMKETGAFAGITSEEVKFKKVEEGDEVANLSEVVAFVSTGTTSKDVLRVAVGERYAYTFTDTIDSSNPVEHYGILTITEVFTTAVGDAITGFSYTNVSTRK